MHALLQVLPTFLRPTSSISSILIMFAVRTFVSLFTNICIFVSPKCVTLKMESIISKLKLGLNIFKINLDVQRATSQNKLFSDGPNRTYLYYVQIFRVV